MIDTKKRSPSLLSALCASALVAALAFAGETLAASPGAGARSTAGAPARAHRPAPATRPNLPHRANWPGRQHRRLPEGSSARTVVDRTGTGMTRTTTVTNAQGETMTSTKTITRDPESGTRTMEMERTGFDGRTSSVSSTTRRIEEGMHRTITVTNPEGRTMTRDVTITRDGEGNRIVQGTQTGFDGETREISRTLPDRKRQPSNEEEPGESAGN